MTQVRSAAQLGFKIHLAKGSLRAAWLGARSEESLMDCMAWSFQWQFDVFRKRKGIAIGIVKGVFIGCFFTLYMYYIQEDVLVLGFCCCLFQVSWGSPGTSMTCMSCLINHGYHRFSYPNILKVQSWSLSLVLKVQKEQHSSTNQVKQLFSTAETIEIELIMITKTAS